MGCDERLVVIVYVKGIVDSQYMIVIRVFLLLFTEFFFHPSPLSSPLSIHYRIVSTSLVSNVTSQVIEGCKCLI